jgi:hypothetical protein
VELHFDLVEEGRAQNAIKELSKVWEHVSPVETDRYQHEMTDAFFYFYHIAHMAKHFENGGCGIRPFIDLWILDNIDGTDNKKRDELLLKGELLKFANAVRKLSKVWFEGAQMDTVSAGVESYILRGGVYGTTENRILLEQQKNGGRFGYMISKIFIPYDVIKFHYPILEKHKWLMPFMQVRRWGKLIFCGGLKRSAKELTVNQTMSKGTSDFTKNLMKQIGLL